jgi:hypothetical protein
LHPQFYDGQREITTILLFRNMFVLMMMTMTMFVLYKRQCFPKVTTMGIGFGRPKQKDRRNQPSENKNFLALSEKSMDKKRYWKKLPLF